MYEASKNQSNSYLSYPNNQSHSLMHAYNEMKNFFLNLF